MIIGLISCNDKIEQKQEVTKIDTPQVKIVEKVVEKIVEVPRELTDAEIQERIIAKEKKNAKKNLQLEVGDTYHEIFKGYFSKVKLTNNSEKLIYKNIVIEHNILDKSGNIAKSFETRIDRHIQPKESITERVKLKDNKSNQNFTVKIVEFDTYIAE